MSNDLLEPRGKNRNYFAARGGGSGLSGSSGLFGLSSSANKRNRRDKTDPRTSYTRRASRAPGLSFFPPATVKDCGPTVMSPW